MQTVEILAGGNFCNAVHQLNLRSAKCAYRYKPREGDCCENYQVWLMSMEDYKVIDAIDDEDWQDDWGWWRWSEGSNMGTAFVEYIVNGEKLKAWDGIHRTMFYSDVCEECSDRKNGLCNASNQDQLRRETVRRPAAILLGRDWCIHGAEHLRSRHRPCTAE